MCGQEDVLQPSGPTSAVRLMVSARWMEPDPDLLPELGEHVISEDGVLLAAHAEEEILQAWRNGDVAKVQNVTTPKVVKVRTLDAPWDLLDLLHHALGRRVANMTSTPVPSGVHVLGDAPVRLEEGAKVDPKGLDAEAGGLDRSKRGSAPGRCWLACACWSGKHHSRAGCRSGFRHWPDLPCCWGDQQFDLAGLVQPCP